jgi:hypothetical protein
MRRLRALALAAGAGAALAFSPLGGLAADLGGVWWIKDRSGKLPVAGPLPFTAEGAALFKKNQALIAAGKRAPEGTLTCMPDGMPRLMLAPYPIQILQRAEQVTILHERQHMIRLIYMARPRPEEDEPAYNGYSTGRWDGEALVVETVGLKGGTVMDATGAPQSDQGRIIERFTVEDGGQTLRVAAEVQDPVVFTAPVRFTLDYQRRPDVRLMEDVCTYGPPQRDRSAPQ